jgi:hypothetical protein
MSVMLSRLCPGVTARAALGGTPRLSVDLLNRGTNRPVVSNTTDEKRVDPVVPGAATSNGRPATYSVDPPHAEEIGAAIIPALDPLTATSRCHSRATSGIKDLEVGGFPLDGILKRAPQLLGEQNPGRLAQLGEHQLDKLGVTGSSPVPPIAETRRKRRVSLYGEAAARTPLGAAWKESGKVSWFESRCGYSERRRYVKPHGCHE